MGSSDQKIVHSWDYGNNKPVWTTESSKNIGKVLGPTKIPWRS
jgi:hypothetical protein